MFDPTAQQIAPLSGELSGFCTVRFTGPDAADFLQGYATCDTAKLEPTSAQAAAFCDLRGRVVANGWLWGTPETVGFLLHASCAEGLAGFLKPYLNFSRTTLSIDDSPPTAAFGAAVSELVDPVTLPSTAAAEARALSGVASASTATDITPQWLSQALMNHEIYVEADISGAFLPQMLGLVDLGAVDFAKGCYLGQEVIARAEHRGKVKRQLLCARFEGSNAPSVGMRLVDSEGVEQGVIAGAVLQDQAAQEANHFVGLLAYVGKTVSTPTTGAQSFTLSPATETSAITLEFY